ncbi:hypothetical protein [Luteibacter sp. SG786]|uniref:hypothetical protein n=1 Tax=Luteibacter sp. SG786 TaxID=2587130 RepID=UPI00141DF865|nr:hypothetical protein [Luteibacter sp. SG786]NII54372.1 hypothetical protein [Luteibacter sp. SG786]
MQETIYFVQGFKAGKRGQLVPLEAVGCATESQAMARAERLGDALAGALAWSQTADVDAGEYGEPVVLVRVGQVPEMV